MKNRKKYTGTPEKHGRYFRIRIKYHGKLITIPTRATSRSEAERLCDELTRPFQAETDEQSAKELWLKFKMKEEGEEKCREDLPYLPLSEGFDAYQRTKKGSRASENTRRMYDCQYNRMVKWMRLRYPNIEELREVNRKMAIQFASWLEGQYSANTHNKYMALLSAIWEELKKQDEIILEDKPTLLTAEDSKKIAHIEVNPWDAVTMLKLQPIKRRPLTEEELRKVFPHTEGEMRGMFLMGLYTMARLKDVVLMRWDNIDLENRWLILKPHKTEKSTGLSIRTYIHDALYDELKAVPTEMRIGYVFPNSAKAYLKNSGEFDKSLNRVFEECGIERQKVVNGRARCVVGFHSLRHTAASFALSAPLAPSIEVVQKQLCHSSSDMTRHYLTPTDDAVRRLIASLPSVTTTENGKGGITAA